MLSPSLFNFDCLETVTVFDTIVKLRKSIVTSQCDICNEEEHTVIVSISHATNIAVRICQKLEKVPDFEFDINLMLFSLLFCRMARKSMSKRSQRSYGTYSFANYQRKVEERFLTPFKRKVRFNVCDHLKSLGVCKVCKENFLDVYWDMCI